LSTKNFSTSKIKNSGDLLKIRSFGFRGEALSAISGVSLIDIVSNDREGGEGWRVTIEGKSTLCDGPAPHEKGTTVRVENLFFNTPARKKFLKSDLTERRRILETILGFALITPELEIHYTENDRPVLDLTPASSWRERLTGIMGGSTMKHMVEVSMDEPPLRLKGFVSLPSHTRANRNHQFYYVNGRLVREKTLVAAVQQAYRSVIPYKRFPAVVLSVEVPFEDVDVNVHPTKLEVRLANERVVFDAVRRGIKRSLTAKSEGTLDVSYGALTGGNRPRVLVESNDAHPTSEPAAAVKVDPTDPAAFPGLVSEAGTRSEKYKTRLRETVTSHIQGVPDRLDVSPQLSLQEENLERPSELPSRVQKERIQEDDALFWQFNNSYILIQVRGGIVVIDQHAAHERIIFDTSRTQMESEIPVSQQILFPITLELSIAELEVFRMTTDTFRKLGFHLEPFGGTNILVRGYPQGLKNWDEGKLLLQIFDDLLGDTEPGSFHVDRIIASFACRSAVKAGQKLSVEEMKMLADQLFAVENPYSCPHGRPTIHRIAVEDLERWFSRR